MNGGEGKPTMRGRSFPRFQPLIEQGHPLRVPRRNEPWEPMILWLTLFELNINPTPGEAVVSLLRHPLVRPTLLAMSKQSPPDARSEKPFSVEAATLTMMTIAFLLVESALYISARILHWLTRGLLSPERELLGELPEAFERIAFFQDQYQRLSQKSQDYMDDFDYDLEK